jgi:hypothetical protein
VTADVAFREAVAYSLGLDPATPEAVLLIEVAGLRAVKSTPCLGCGSALVGSTVLTCGDCGFVGRAVVFGEQY